MAVNSKSKGSTFERVICKKLSLWWTNGKRVDIFWRSAGSGAMATTAHRSGSSRANMEGDISYSDAIGKPLIDMFCIELKSGYGDWNVTDLIESNQKETVFEKFWNQASESALHSNALPMLIYHKDRKNTMVAINLEAKTMLKKQVIARHSLFDIPYFNIRVSNKIGDIYIYRFLDFFEAIKPEDIKGVLHACGRD